MDLELDGLVAIVTGASRGLGREAALGLAAEGARVLVVARSAGALAGLEAVAPGQIAARICDMRDRDAVSALPDQARERFGRVDIVVNNAGIAPAADFLEVSGAALQEVLEVNVVAPALLSAAAARAFIDQGRRGAIINVASISGVRGKAGLAAYSASKGALIQLTRALSAEWARHDIQVNAIAPGGFITEAQQAVLDDPDLHRRRIRKIPARRMAAAEEIRIAICTLASPRSRFTTGSVIVIDGGETARI
jgi:2-dehydro-3-deoxy-D-gluconate 5-dehydrogenase